MKQKLKQERRIFEDENRFKMEELKQEDDLRKEEARRA